MTLEQEMEAVYLLYNGLARELDRATGLGGKLLFAGEPTENAIRLLRAANIAGAASLAASADTAALRRIMREGALDFVVTDLDEAVRILKNEIRKKLPVAVGVSQPADEVVREMLGRGLQPDLVAPNLAATPDHEILVFRGARAVEALPLAPGITFRVLNLPPADQQTAAAFDESLLASLAEDDQVNRRWVRVAARYLPATARRLRSVAIAEPRLF